MLFLSMYFERSFNNVKTDSINLSVPVEFVIDYYAQKFLFLNILN